MFRNSWRQVLVTIGARMAENVSYYVLTAFILVYVTTGLHLPKGVGLSAVLIGSAVHFVTIPLWGALSDRVGRRPVYLFGAVGMALWGFAFFALLDTKSSAVIVLATTVGLVLHGAMYGPQAAFFAEQFPTRVRYSGALGRRPAVLDRGRGRRPADRRGAVLGLGQHRAGVAVRRGDVPDHGDRAARRPGDARPVAARRQRRGGDGGRFALA